MVLDIRRSLAHLMILTKFKVVHNTKYLSIFVYLDLSEYFIRGNRVSRFSSLSS